MIVYLDLDDLLVAAAAVVDDLAVRDYGLLESALTRPKTSVFGNDAYPSLHDKAAALLHLLARNHALVDGNKRAAWMAARLFLDLNGVSANTVDVDDAERLVVAVARGDLDVPAIASALAKLVG